MVLGACCIVTALSLKHSITRKDQLRYEAAHLQNNLLVKERIIDNFLRDPKQLEGAKQYHLNDDYGMNFINTYREKGINMLTFQNGVLRFWSTIRAIPTDPEFIREGSSFVQFPNGWYEVIKKTSGSYIILFLIDVKNQYAIQNQYLDEEISPLLSASNALTKASFTDENTYPIHNLQGKLLFEVKLKPGYTRGIYATVEIWLWSIGLFSICLFFNSFCSWLVKKGQLVPATILLCLFFAGVRITDLEFGWFNRQFDLLIFSPRIYAESFFMPSLGDFLLNVIALTWVVLFVYTYRDRYQVPRWFRHHRIFGFVLLGVFLLIFTVVALLFDKVFFGLIINSKINFDITNIVNLGWISWVSIIILCLVWFNVYLIVIIFLQQTKQLNISDRERLVFFLCALTLYFFYQLMTGFSLFFVACALFVFVTSWNFYKNENRFSIGIFAAIFFCLAFISAMKYLKFTGIKERYNRMAIAQRLVSSDDFKVISAIEHLEKNIQANSFVQQYFRQPALSSEIELQKHIDKQYLEDYLPRFDYNIYEYNNLDSSTTGHKGTELSYFKGLVKAGSVKVQESAFFYRVNDTFGYQNYFGIIPILENEQLLGTLVIEFKSQPYNYRGQLPELLLDRTIRNDDDYGNYSVALYKDGKLENQSGKYTYKLNSGDYHIRPMYAGFFTDSLNYTHLAYSPVASKLVIISRENISAVVYLATLSFFFLVFILFSVALYILIWLLKNIDESWNGWFNINRSLMINANKVLYKTRIQFSIVLSVVATLLIVGWTTYFYIRDEYRRQQQDFIREKIRNVQQAYERKILSTGLPYPTDKALADFNQFADANAVYLNLYDINGRLLFTSLPRMYDQGILNRRIGPKAFMTLSMRQESEFINSQEKIGTFSYAAAYAPIRDVRNQVIAYIGVPYYANEADYHNKIGVFINTLINIYALVFVAIGILAVFLANQITSPLTFIQESIRKTKLGQKNQPIGWSRHDEIGSLIKEYNKMIAALEESAGKLARSERESAWREMAKQVAHEIKNPLTPLKLGVQLLERAWKENDPNFDRKFERFSKSFIEQIDSLSTIASEFSNFAKMPDTKLEKLLLLPVIDQARDVFINTQDADIHIRNKTTADIIIKGDKDQLLRTFNNLFKNAIEAASTDRKCVVGVTISNDKENVMIEVDDNGKGIDPALHEKIFVPNFTTKSSGTGLGLAFVKQAVENAGGSIAFKSFADVGTTFYLTFPLA